MLAADKSPSSPHYITAGAHTVEVLLSLLTLLSFINTDSNLNIEANFDRLF
jgi:hypothetical protein